MRNAIAIVAILFGTQGALADTRSSVEQPFANWKPVVGTVSSTIVGGETVVTRVTRPSVQRLAMLTQVPVKTWSTQVEYQHNIDRPDLVAAIARNEETARPGFATLQRSFGKGEFRPYVGVGVGVAATQFDTMMPTAEESYAVKGVVGSNLIFTDKVGAFVQYDYAVATEREAATGGGKSHGLSFGLRISLH